MVIREHKLGPIALHNIRQRIVMKGTGKTLLEVSINDRLCGSREVEIECL